MESFEDNLDIVQNKVEKPQTKIIRNKMTYEKKSETFTPKFCSKNTRNLI